MWGSTGARKGCPGFDKHSKEFGALSQNHFKESAYSTKSARQPSQVDGRRREEELEMEGEASSDARRELQVLVQASGRAAGKRGHSLRGPGGQLLGHLRSAGWTCSSPESTFWDTINIHKVIVMKSLNVGL